MYSLGGSNTTIFFLLFGRGTAGMEHLHQNSKMTEKIAQLKWI